MAHPTTVNREGSLLIVGRGPDSVGFPTPDQIRLSIQQLVAEQEVEQAHELAQEGLQTYPENEGVLAIAGLLAMVRNEWDRAVVLLEKLLIVQGDRASDYTRMMYERARTCCDKTVTDVSASLVSTPADKA